MPVDAGHESNGHAPAQMIGNGWEWTRDVFAPFEGFAAASASIPATRPISSTASTT